tara:strand:- start:1110 stop:1826 length:717 start_codon:yes stop_codon:yes gene_type:complete
MTQEYASLLDAIEKYSDQPTSMIPAKLRKRIEDEFPQPWGGLDKHQRKVIARDIDAKRDPGKKDMQENGLVRGFERVQTKNMLHRLRSRPTGMNPSEELAAYELKGKLERDLSNLEKAPVDSALPVTSKDYSERTAAKASTKGAELNNRISTDRFSIGERRNELGAAMAEVGNAFIAEHDRLPSELELWGLLAKDSERYNLGVVKREEKILSYLTDSGTKNVKYKDFKQRYKSLLDKS